MLRSILPHPLVVLLLVSNVVVYFGRIWPEGAPPFARRVSIAFLVGTLLAFGSTLRRRAR